MWKAQISAIFKEEAAAGLVFLKKISPDPLRVPLASGFVQKICGLCRGRVIDLTDTVKRRHRGECAFDLITMHLSFQAHTFSSSMAWARIHTYEYDFE